MRRAALKRTAFSAPKSAWVRNSPFPSRKRPLKAVTGQETTSQTRVKTLKAAGKKGREWIEARKWLSRHFKYAGIISCEARLKGCWGETALSWAHCRKRRELLDGEIYHVALLCIPCHDQYERKSHEDMHTGIHEIIDRRGLICPPSNT